MERCLAVIKKFKNLYFAECYWLLSEVYDLLDPVFDLGVMLSFRCSEHDKLRQPVPGLPIPAPRGQRRRGQRPGAGHVRSQHPIRNLLRGLQSVRGVE